MLGSEELGPKNNNNNNGVGCSRGPRKDEVVLQVVTGKEGGGRRKDGASHPNSAEARGRSQDQRGYRRMTIT